MDIVELDGAQNEMISIPRYEYDSMTERLCKLDLILGLLFNTAALSFDGKELRLGGIVFEETIRALYPVQYQKMLEALQEEGEKE